MARLLSQSSGPFPGPAELAAEGVSDGTCHDRACWRATRPHRAEDRVARRRLLFRLVTALLAAPMLLGVWPLASKQSASACSQPPSSSIAAAFDLAANGAAPTPFPGSSTSRVQTVPPSILKAIGWLESRWEQYTPARKPLISSDFGYGIMQVTSGMAGAFGNPRGTIDPAIQSRIASDYAFNIAYGAAILRHFFVAMPRIGNGDPAVLENWYYAVWAYNSWGWINNPNNPRFSRRGTPATNPLGFPYEDTVFYYAAHPPRDTAGNPLWAPVPVKVPPRSRIGRTAAPFTPTAMHRQAASSVAAAYAPDALRPVHPSQSQSIGIRATNTGKVSWRPSVTAPFSLVYHVFTQFGNPWGEISPFSPGVVAFGQGQVPITHSLLPGKSVALRATVRAPAVPGTYRIAWDLQVGSATWLSGRGVPPGVQRLRVFPKAQSLPTVVNRPPAPSIGSRRGLMFLRETAGHDGATVRPKQQFLSGWLVFNNGPEPWLPGERLRLTRGPSLGARAIALPATPVCHSANVLVTLQAPSRKGSYHSVWRLLDSTGHSQGDPVSVVITVR